MSPVDFMYLWLLLMRILRSGPDSRLWVSTTSLAVATPARPSIWPLCPNPVHLSPLVVPALTFSPVAYPRTVQG